MATDGQFAGRVALVTGGGSGIGRATAIELGRQGARVAVLSRRPDRIAETCARITEVGGEAMGISADATSEEALDDAIRQVDARWGRLDLVVANAGANGVWAPLEELTLDEWNRTVATNLTSTFLTTKASLPLLKRRGGAIVVISSVNGTRNFSNPGTVAYSTSKAGQVAFVKMTAIELAQHGIRINVVCPGAIQTNIEESTQRRKVDTIRWPVEFPQGRFPMRDGGPAEPEQVARVVAFLLSDAADYVTGTEMWVDAGLSLVVG